MGSYRAEGRGAAHSSLRAVSGRQEIVSENKNNCDDGDGRDGGHAGNNNITLINIHPFHSMLRMAFQKMPRELLCLKTETYKAVRGARSEAARADIAAPMTSHSSHFEVLE